MLLSPPVSLLPGTSRVPSRKHFRSSRRRRKWDGRISAQKNDDVASEYLELEMEIFQFMETSGRPDVFPSKQDLIDAGRLDLADLVQKRGGWLAVGWEDENEGDFFDTSQYSDPWEVGPSSDPFQSKGTQFLDQFEGSGSSQVYASAPSIGARVGAYVGRNLGSQEPEVRDLTGVQTSGLGNADSGIEASPDEVSSADFSGEAQGLPAVESSPKIPSERFFIQQLDAIRDKLLASLGLDFPPIVIPKYGNLNSSAKSLELEREKPPNGPPEILEAQELTAEISGTPTKINRYGQSDFLKEWADIIGENGQSSEGGQGTEGQSGEDLEASAHDTVPGGAQEMAPGVAVTDGPSELLAETENAAAARLEALLGGASGLESAGEGVRLEDPATEDALDTETTSEAGALSGPSGLWQENRAAALDLDSSASTSDLSGVDLLDGQDGGGRVIADKEGEETNEEEGGGKDEAEGQERANLSEEEAGAPASQEGSRFGTGEANLSLEGEGRGDESSEAAESEGDPARKGKPPNYWQDLGNLRRELQSAQAALGLPDDVIPSRRQLIAIRRWDIMRAVRRQGGFQQVAERLGVGEEKVKEAGVDSPGEKVKEVQKEEPAPAPQPPPPDLSPLGRLLNLLGLGPKPDSKPEPATPVREPDASSSIKELDAEEDERIAQDEQSVAQRLKETVALENWGWKKGRRREEKEGLPGADEADRPEEGSAGGSTSREAETKGETETETATATKTERDTGGALLGRIRSLEQSLASTREALQHDREALVGNREFLREMRLSTLDELSQVSDSLEFREDEMARTARNLRRTQAEMRALAGSMASGSLGGPEAVDAILAGPGNPAGNPEGVPVQRRMVRVVWPHEGREVELAGSFDGWEGKVKMEMSNAGVHIATLKLPPGRYEIKFIVDGVWRVDAQRLITYEDNNENNVLQVV
ncbi:putative 5-AMP-activated protein kinase [Klebsormidium nitens]|uniref:Putative 5-AMP-activated protein kinase n=1 Tax=Klebsormidium nitens TaxID=105231 RepID=A0A1Y1I3X4_KLENI|nr:putative 5-AMP-activated protein kinase [Klebsormidium nitens]|eukprot:GAQ83436.1 putative 5-AMP-activated protein kinase [Klebsormidium nitens]